MRWLGEILTLLVLVAACVWAFLTVRAFSARAELACENETEKNRADDLDRRIADVSAAGKKADAEYKKLERDYMNADVQARILIADQKTVLDELTATRKRDAALENEQLRRILKALGARKP